VIRSVLQCLKVLPRQDQVRVRLMIFAQFVLSLLDLFAVAIFGALGSIAVKGVQSQESSTLLDKALIVLNLSHLSFQQRVAMLAIGAAILLILKTFLSSFVTRKSLHFLASRGASISTRMIRNSLVDRRETVDGMSSQDILYTVTTGVSNITLGVLGTSIALAADVSLLIVMSVALFVVDFLTALVTLTFFALIGLTLHFALHKKSAKLGRAQAEITVQSNDDILTIHRAHPEIIVRNSAEYFVGKVTRQRFELAKGSAAIAFLPYVGKYVVETAIVLGVLLLSFVQFLAQDAASASGTLIFFMVAATRIAPSILRLQHGVLTINYSANASLKTLSLMRTESATEQSSEIEDEQVGRFESNVKMMSVTFTYPRSEKPVLENISLEINSGEFVAIVGPTGAGKSTLIEVMLGIRSPQIGKVEISNARPDTTYHSWPGKIAYVPQEVFITKGSIRENLLLGLNPLDFSDNYLTKLLGEVKLLNFLSENNLTLDSPLHENGENLSGGQKQRIGIARALLTKPKLLILDEATSSLDGSTEMEISQTIQENQGIETLVVIAHRLSTVKRASKVVYLEQGKIRAQGTIQEVQKLVPDFEVQAKLMGL
jgi:ABC-type multidrug transport system fused ATPase/permease subunit